MTFGQKLQELRKQQNLSQEELALNLQVSRQSVSKWELDVSAPEIDKVVQISRLFDVSIDYLLKEEIQHPSHQKLTGKKNQWQIWLGIGCVLFSSVSFFIIWILEKIYPAPICFYNSATQRWKVGLENFIWVHGLENFLFFCGILFIAGILLIFHKQTMWAVGRCKNKIVKIK